MYQPAKAFFSIAIVFLLCILSPCQTVGNSGSIRGQVSDQTGAILAGATVTLHQTASGQTIQHITNHEGRFAFPVQPVGIYSLSVTRNGFRTAQVSGIVVQIGQSSTANIRLQPGAEVETITISEPP